VSRYGLVALASSLDQAGPCARTVLDTALLHAVIGGYDPMDSTSIHAPVPRWCARRSAPTSPGMRIGVVKQLTGEGYQPGVQAALRGVRPCSSTRAPRSSRSTAPFRYALAAYYLILPSEASSNLAKFDAMRYGLRVLPEGVDDPSAEQVMAATREAGFGDEVKRRIILGTYALSSGYYDAYYGQAQKVRRLIAARLRRAFEVADVLVSPTAPTTAFKIGEKLDDPLAMYLNDVATIPANLAGMPGMSVPSGVADEDGLPTGFQILAPAMADERLYAVGSALERELAAGGAGICWPRPRSWRRREVTSERADH
jgi:aspartyl-tRNA(Asn)/glutamyl-tRNA(Gln) amidotransferase subunit A